MEEKTLKRLEYYKVLEQLASFAGSPLGKEQAAGLHTVQKATASGVSLSGTDFLCCTSKF